MIGRLGLRIGWAYHRLFDRMTGGRFRTDRLLGPTLWLTTIGRRTGISRENALICLVDGGRYVVVASNGGSEAEPAWFRNLIDHPDAWIRIGRERRPVVARLAAPEEAARLWPRLDVAYPTFARYRSHTARALPVVILDPRAESAMEPSPGIGP